MNAAADMRWMSCEIMAIYGSLNVSKWFPLKSLAADRC